MMRQSRGASATSSARRNLEEIVTRRSRREPGLLTAYFEANPRLDPDLTPIDDLVTLIESLYSMEVLDLLEQEGHFWNVLKTDLEGVSRTRSFKIYQAVGGSVFPIGHVELTGSTTNLRRRKPLNSKSGPRSKVQAFGERPSRFSTGVKYPITTTFGA